MGTPAGTYSHAASSAPLLRSSTRCRPSTSTSSTACCRRRTGSRQPRRGKGLLAGDDGTETVADHVQRVVVVAVPVLRTFVRGARFTRIPWVLVATTAFSVGSAVRIDVREAQVIGSLIAYRLEQAAGRPADPAPGESRGAGLLRSTRGQCRRPPSPVATGADTSTDGRDRAAEMGRDLVQAVAVLDVRDHGQAGPVERRRPDRGSHLTPDITGSHPAQSTPPMSRL